MHAQSAGFVSSYQGCPDGWACSVEDCLLQVVHGGILGRVPAAVERLGPAVGGVLGHLAALGDEGGWGGVGGDILCRLLRLTVCMVHKPDERDVTEEARVLRLMQAASAKGRHAHCTQECLGHQRVGTSTSFICQTGALPGRM